MKIELEYKKNDNNLDEVAMKVIWFGIVISAFLVALILTGG